MHATFGKWALLSAVAAGLLPGAPGGRAQEARVIEITAKRFQFTPSEVHVRPGETVTLRLRSQDVKHGFFMKPLGIDATIEPGKITDVTVTPREPGRFPVICDHFCGAGHGNMKMEIVVE